MKSLVVSVCMTAVTDMAAVSEHQKERQKNPEEPRRTPEEHQKNTRRETAAMSVTAVIQTETTSDFI